MNIIEEAYNFLNNKFDSDENTIICKCFYYDGDLYESKHDIYKNNFSLLIKIKKSRKNEVIKVISQVLIDYKVIYDGIKGICIEVIPEKSYIFIEYVVNSHIIIPNSFLEKFGYKEKTNGYMVNYYNTVSGEANIIKVKDYNSKFAYYDYDIEEYLSKFEAQIGDLRKELHNFNDAKEHNFFTKDRDRIIKDFFEITLLRNPQTANRINANSLTAIIGGKLSPSNIIATHFMEDKSNFFADMNSCFILNKTRRGFVINDSLIIEMSVNNKESLLLMPISPKEAISLISKSYYNKLFETENDNRYYLEIKDENVISSLNQKTFYYAKSKRENIIGLKEDLEQLINRN